MAVTGGVTAAPPAAALSGATRILGRRADRVDWAGWRRAARFEAPSSYRCDVLFLCCCDLLLPQAVTGSVLLQAVTGWAPRGLRSGLRSGLGLGEPAAA